MTSNAQAALLQLEKEPGWEDLTPCNLSFFTSIEVLGQDNP